MAGYKDKHGVSRFANFIKKAGAVIPEILEAGTMLATGNIMGALGHVGELLGASATDPELSEKARELMNEFELKKVEFELEAYRIETQDRDSARQHGDKKLQRMVAYFTLGGFTIFGCLQMYLVYQSMTGAIKINEFALTTVSYIEGIFTAMLFTLKDFLWGGSMKE